MFRRLLDSPWLYFGLAGLLALVGLFSLVEFRGYARPLGSPADLDRLRERDDLNVVFFLIDTLRADHLSAYGYERETSPMLDYLARTGVRFAHVEAQSSWTKSSMASLWTGVYPHRTGVTRYPDALAPEATLPAEILREAGLFTGGIYRNGWVAPNFGFAQGFDVYFQPRFPSMTPRRFERHNPSAHALEGSDWNATESALEFIRANAHKRFFLYVHYMDPHQYMYDAEHALFGTEIRGIYDNAIRWTDDNIDKVMGALQQRDVLSRTVIAIASDHGEAFYEHGSEGHARDLYREVTETPLILALPFRLEPGIVVETPVQNVDLWPTILDLLGLGPLPGADGRSLVPLIRAAADGASGGVPPELAERPSFAELDRTWGLTNGEPRPMVAVVSGRYRLIDHRGEAEDAAASRRVELYDRSVDRLEQRDVAEQYPEIVAELRGRVDAYLAVPPAFEAPQVELDELRLNQLRALGYAVK